MFPFGGSRVHTQQSLNMHSRFQNPEIGTPGDIVQPVSGAVHLILHTAKHVSRQPRLEAYKSLPTNKPNYKSNH